MARIRNIKPEVVSDVKLARVSRDARLTFVYMITQADDLGLIPGAHRQLLGILFPVDDAVTIGMLLGWIEELVSAGMVRWRATRDGVPVLQLINWTRHQRIDNAGRSQLGALLAESPEDGSPQLAEDRGESPRDAELRGSSPLGPRTKDQEPRTEMSLLVACAREANRGLAEHATSPQAVPGILPTTASTRAAVDAMLAYGILPDFCLSALYELAKSHRSERPIRSLQYFTAAAIRLWDEHQAAAAVRTTGAPAALGSARRGAPQRMGRIEQGRANLANALERRERERAAAAGGTDGN